MLPIVVNRWLRIFVGLFLVAATAGAAPIELGGDAAKAGADATDNSGVYVRDSAIALERLALAQRMERLKEWGKSADLYQEILVKYPDRVVAASGQAGPPVAQYTSVTEAVCQALCKWPPEGLDVYRSRFETPAANLLASVAGSGGAQNLQILHQVYSLYFPTNSGKLAGIRLMDAYFEAGDYAAVAQIGRRLLDWHPDLTAERPMTLYRTALAERLSGDNAEAKHHAEELRQRFPQAVGAIRGADAALADSLDQELAAGGPAVRTVSDSWMTFGGD